MHINSAGMGKTSVKMIMCMPLGKSKVRNVSLQISLDLLKRALRDLNFQNMSTNVFSLLWRTGALLIIFPQKIDFICM